MPIKEILKTKYPLIQGAMAHIATGRFAAAVSNAGGLGVIGSGGMDVDTLESHIELCQSLTNLPFAVNLMLMNPHCDAMVDIIIKHQVPIVTTGAGSPGIFMERLKNAGIKVIPVVPTVALARRVESMGADAVIVEGTEAGGHVGELTTMALVPQVVSAVQIPVIAAGGIASGEQLIAAFALGASAVQVGTCLLVAEECEVHPNYKQAVIEAKDTATTVTGRISGVPVRILKNRMAKAYVRLEKQGQSKEELEYLTLGSLRRAVFEGDIKDGSVMLGQVAGMVTHQAPMKDIIDQLFIDADAALKTLNQGWLKK